MQGEPYLVKVNGQEITLSAAIWPTTTIDGIRYSSGTVQHMPDGSTRTYTHIPLAQVKERAWVTAHVSLDRIMKTGEGPKVHTA